MDEQVKLAYIEELRKLMDQFYALQVNPNATKRDHARIVARIHQVCDTLDVLETTDGVH